MTPISAEAPKKEDKVIISINPAENLSTGEAADPIINDEANPGEIADEYTLDNDQTNLIPEHTNTSKKNRLINLSIGAIAAAGAVITAGSVMFSFFGGDTSKKPKPTDANLPAGFTDTTTANSESETSTSIDETEVTLATTENSASTISETTSGSAVETKNNTETTYDYTKYVENAVECYGFFELTADQQAEIKKFEAMSIEEYQALPQTEQLVFAQWFFDNYKGRFDQILKNAKINLIYTENPTTPQEYSDNYAYITTMASTIITSSQRADGTYTGNKTDVLTGQKLMSLRDTATAAHNEANNSYINGFSDIVIIAKINTSVTGYKATEDGMILNTHQETTDNMTVGPNAADAQQVFEPFTVFDIDGNKVVLELCTLSIRLDDPRAVEVTPVK